MIEWLKWGQSKTLLVVNVTATDINNGKQNSPNQCPVAISLRRQFTKAFEVRVSAFEDYQIIGLIWTVSINHMKYNISFDIPKRIVQKISHYDKTGEMKPFKFTIER